MIESSKLPACPSSSLGACMMAKKSVMLSYCDRNKIVDVPKEKEETDIAYLEAEFRKSFAYQNNVSILISFQKFDTEWQEYIELDEHAVVDNKDKLKVVVTPRLVTPLSSAQVRIIT